MKYILAILAFVVFAFLVQPFIPGSYQNTLSADTTAQNPNGSSELALLMRDMQQFTNSAKTDLKEGKNPAKYPAAFDKIYTAQISEGMTKSDFYKSFADLYVMSVKNYSNSTPQQRVETYNNMVAACLACHSQHCPGPVPVIKKMTWEK